MHYRGDNMNKEEKLKELLVESRLKIVKLQVPKGHCPYSYYGPTLPDDLHIDCADFDFDCSDCKENFMKLIESQIRKEVSAI